MNIKVCQQIINLWKACSGSWLYILTTGGEIAPFSTQCRKGTSKNFQILLKWLLYKVMCSWLSQNNFHFIEYTKIHNHCVSRSFVYKARPVILIIKRQDYHHGLDER